MFPESEVLDREFSGSSHSGEDAFPNHGAMLAWNSFQEDWFGYRIDEKRGGLVSGQNIIRL
jgi:hypothetical protein